MLTQAPQSPDLDIWFPHLSNLQREFYSLHESTKNLLCQF